MVKEWAPPDVTESINRMTFHWPTLELKILAGKIADDGIAELWFYHANGSPKDSLLHVAKANLLSSSTMTQLAKRLATNSEDVPWQQIMTYLSASIMEYQRRGEPSVLIETNDRIIEHPGYYIEPIILRGAPSVIYGDKGVNKTTLALTCLGLIANGDSNSQSELIANETVGIGMLDWESNQSLTEYTISRLIHGHTLKPFRLPYLRCKQPLTDDIDRIAGFITDNQITVVLIDSLGQAAGSDKFDSAGKGAALKFFECLRLLNVTPLIIGQNSKNEEGKKSIYGSTYYTYYSRNIFELKGKQDEHDESRQHVILIHQEANYSKKYAPIGFCVDYTDTTISIKREAASFAEFVEKARQITDVLDFLSTGAKSIKEIKDEFAMTENNVRVMLSRAKAKGLVIAVGKGMWEKAPQRTIE
jgi:hypothetical protein